MARNAVSFHADGVWGGLTPKAQIVMGFFTEYFAIPDRVTYQLPDEVPGQLVEIDRHGGQEIVREIQAQIFLSPDVARTLIPWLQERLEQFDATEARMRPSATPNSDAAIGTIEVKEEPS